MFQDKTVFILGAGASWHYGYPTGEELINNVLEKAALAAGYFREYSGYSHITPEFVKSLNPIVGETSRRDAWFKALQHCEEFVRRLRAIDPPVIDYFLGQNSHLEAIGRLLIAWVILERSVRSENIHNLNRKPEERQKNDNWCRFVLSRIAAGCSTSSDLLKNKVNFITFNYDLSLEERLSTGLQHTALFSKSDVEKFLGDDRIVHMYGHVGHTSSAIRDMPMNFNVKLNEHASAEQWKNHFDLFYTASKNLFTIDPKDKETDERSLKTARSLIRASSCIYILGFGFDEQNCARLGFNRTVKQTTRATPKRIFYTNFRDINRVNKSASKQFFNNWNKLGPGMFVDGDARRGWFYEKSIRDCYEALALDFGTAESELWEDVD